LREIQRNLHQLRASLFQLEPDHLKLLLKEAVPEYDPRLVPPGLVVASGLDQSHSEGKAKLAL
jgi:hypothetical protein